MKYFILFYISTVQEVAPTQLYKKKTRHKNQYGGGHATMRNTTLDMIKKNRPFFIKKIVKNKKILENKNKNYDNNLKFQINVFKQILKSFFYFFFSRLKIHKIE